MSVAAEPSWTGTQTAFAVAVLWALFQLWYASPLPYALGIFVLNEDAARAVHLAFALALVFAPGWGAETLPRRIVGIVLSCLGIAAALYLVVFSDALAARTGEPLMADLMVGALGLVLLLEATRRALGPALVVIALVFLAYSLAGPFMPEVIAHKGASLTKVITHQWLTSEGVFGVALGVSTSFVFLFVLFGALLERAGAGAYFIRLAFALLGAARGGPAKAAVLASGLTGLVSGSSIANVVTTGTFTIPLMKRVGLAPHKAGAVEVSASVNGQIMPPVMGAAAFLMVDYVGISYVDVLRHALVPALISYAALFFIVHLEAVRTGLTGLPRATPVAPLHWLASAFYGFFGVVILAAAVYYGLGWLKGWLGPWAGAVVAGGLVAAYGGLLAYSVRQPPLPEDEAFAVVPPLGPVLAGGLHYLLPLVLLVWLLVVERVSPGLAAFYASLFLIFILLTQEALTAWLTGRPATRAMIGRAFAALAHGLAGGAQGMVAVALATATAGIIVGTVSLTGVGLSMTELVEVLSGGNLVLVLAFTAVICLVLGLGLPTTANYIVVATLMAPVIVALAGQAGLVVPLIAAHLFVFYFGLLADVTPPVGLATYAAGALASADPLRTGLTSFFYSLRTVVLPFVFIFNSELLLIGATSYAQAMLAALAALIGMLAFTAATMGVWIVRNRLVETVSLLLIAFSLFRPEFWLDRIAAPDKLVRPSWMDEVVADTPVGAHLRFIASGDTLMGRRVTRTVALRLDTAGRMEARLAAAGLYLTFDDVRPQVERVDHSTQAHKIGLEPGWAIEGFLVPNDDRPPKETVYIAALLALFWVWGRQRHRARAP